MREKGGPAQALRRLRCSGYGADERWRDHDIIAVAAVRPAVPRTHQPPQNTAPRTEKSFASFSLSLRQCDDVTGRNLALDVSGRLL